MSAEDAMSGTMGGSSTISEALHALILAAYASEGAPVMIPREAIKLPAVDVRWAPVADRPWIWLLSVETAYTQMARAFVMRFGRAGETVVYTDPDKAAVEALWRLHNPSPRSLIHG